MFTHRFILFLAMSSLLTMVISPSAYAAEAKMQTTTITGTYTPAKGSEDRKAILDALRVVIRKMSGLEVIFVVRHLKLNNGWAWIETEPESADGKNHYESMVGLMHKKNGRWAYVEGPPEFVICEADPDCIDTTRYFKKTGAEISCCLARYFSHTLIIKHPKTPKKAACTSDIYINSRYAWFRWLVLMA